MKAPEIKSKDDKMTLEGHFEFKISDGPLIWSEDDLKPYRKIEFYLNPEVPHTLMQMDKLNLDNEVLIESYGKRIKEDFIDFLRKKL